MHFGLCYWIIAINGVVGNCVYPSLVKLQFIIEYAKTRSWEHLVIFDGTNPNECAVEYMRPLLQCLSNYGIKLAIQPAVNPNLLEVLNIRGHRVSAIVFLDGLNLTSTKNVLHLASQNSKFDYYVSWLLIATNVQITALDNLLRDLHIRIDSDVTVATTFLDAKEYDDLIYRYRNRWCIDFQMYRMKHEYKQTSGAENNLENAVKLEYATIEKNKTKAFYLAHVYKIRANDNSSFIIEPLGSWNPGARNVKKPLSVKLRNNFRNFSLKIGLYNGSSQVVSKTNDDDKIFNDVEPMMSFMKHVADMINATLEFIPHETLGSFSNKAWTGMLLDVVNGDLDAGLGYISETFERHQHMSFSIPIGKHVRNIYYVEPASERTRDIFLAPFSPTLLGCVVTTYFIIIATMEVINYVAKITHHDEDKTHAGLGEATLWCISIMCMQGSPWTPISRSGKGVLLVGLMFALVTYNAYSGYITSILSVKQSKIYTISDFHQYRFTIGYYEDDEDFIRSSNDSSLRDFYASAYSNREQKGNAVDGLLKAVGGNYAFFVSGALARQILKTNVISKKQKCNLQELYLNDTESKISLPMAKTCPYKKIINLSLLRMKELGAVKRTKSKMFPPMPKCKSKTAFNSAGIKDVYSAYGILLVGVVASTIIGIAERMWQKRLVMRKHILHSIHITHRKSQSNNSLKKQQYPDNPSEKKSSQSETQSLHRRKSAFLR